MEMVVDLRRGWISSAMNDARVDLLPFFENRGIIRFIKSYVSYVAIVLEPPKYYRRNNAGRMGQANAESRGFT